MKKQFVSDLKFWLTIAIQSKTKMQMSFKSKGILPAEYADVPVQITDVKSGRYHEFVKIMYATEGGGERSLSIDTDEDISVDISYDKKGFKLVINNTLTFDATHMLRGEREVMHEILSPKKYNTKQQSED